MDNLHTDLDHYKDQWEKALKDGFLEKSPHLPEKSIPDFFGQYDAPEETTINECDAKYWQQLYQRTTGQEPMIVEATTKEQIKEKTNKVAGAANPIIPSTTGKDQDMKVTPNWSDGKELRELSDLKIRLEKLESQMNAQEGLGKNGSATKSKIDALKQQIDELSDDLTNHRTGVEEN